MAEPKRGSVEAFKAAEKRRQERLKKPSAPKSDARKEAFNKKVAAINKANTDQGSVARFKSAEARRQERLAKVNKPKYDSPKMKRQRAQADVEKDLPKATTTAGKVAGATAAGAAGAATKTAAKTATKPLASPTKALGTFAEAFKKARSQGAGTKFAYNDKMYSAVTKDDISRAGKSNLTEYLNTLKRKDMKIAKAPGQKAMGGVMKKRAGGMASPFEREKMERMIRSAKAAGETLQRPGMPRERLKERMREKADAARDRNVRLKERMKPMKGERRVERARTKGQVSDMEMKFKSGGSVMARGCKMGRKKATKLY
jgi:hypothetical protein